MLEAILDRRNVERALKQVESNKGACGVDGMQVDELGHTLNTQWEPLRARIMEGIYKPQPVCKVEIPKPQGGTRMLAHTNCNRQADIAMYQPGFKSNV